MGRGEITLEGGKRSGNVKIIVLFDGGRWFEEGKEAEEVLGC